MTSYPTFVFLCSTIRSLELDYIYLNDQVDRCPHSVRSQEETMSLHTILHSSLPVSLSLPTQEKRQKLLRRTWSVLKWIWISIILAVFIGFIAGVLISKPDDFLRTIWSTLVWPSIWGLSFKCIITDVMLLVFILLSVFSGLNTLKERDQEEDQNKAILATLIQLTETNQAILKALEDLHKANQQHHKGKPSVSNGVNFWDSLAEIRYLREPSPLETLALMSFRDSQPPAELSKFYLRNFRIYK
jgi:uncharacterized membrane protein YcjF (UPF0283 family)